MVSTMDVRMKTLTDCGKVFKNLSTKPSRLDDDQWQDGLDGEFVPLQEPRV